jgi:hypothetical protein
MSDERDEQSEAIARIPALLGHLSTIVWIADRDADPAELIEQIRVEAELAKGLGLRAPGGREEGKRAA